MCRPVECMVCRKTTWAGCGAHVDQVMSRVPPERRCSCSETAGASPSSESSVWGAIKKAIGGPNR